MLKVLVMSGGRSERMRATMSSHKALVEVNGVSLLERNVRILRAFGLADITVAVNVSEIAVIEAVEALGIETLIEVEPLGTIGAARAAIGDARTLLVVNVDNLSSLDLPEMIRFHCERDAAMTIASHVEQWRMPFGELVVHGDRVEAYREKPTVSMRISSGTYVLDARACAQIPGDRATSVPQLYERLRAAGEPVLAFAHEAPWIDVNDREALTRAEVLIEDHRAGFEPWAHAVR